MSESPKNNKRAVSVGVFVLLGLIFLIAGVLMIGDLHETFKKKMQVISQFNDVNGLQTGNSIWFSGVKIGTVNRIDLYGESQVVVGLKIDINAQQFIRKDALVKISTDGLIGNKILVIYGGTSKFGEVQEGDTLAVENTFSTEDMINTLQKNNENILAITTDFMAISTDIKSVSKKLTTNEGTIGKLLNDDDLYRNINTAAATLKNASAKAQELTGSLATFSAGLNKEGSLANDIVTDTVIYNSIKNSVLQLQEIADTAALFVANLKEAASNPRSSIGVLLHDEKTGAHLKETLKNLESGSKKLDEDLEAVQHSFLLRGFFKKKAKAAKKALSPKE